MTFSALRKSRVAGTISAIKEICRSESIVSRETLVRIEAELRKLAAHPELFPADEFGISATDKIVLYRLSEDDDHKFALYYQVANAPASVPPHNHTTWACIAGISGVEENTLYDSTNGGAPIMSKKTRVSAGESISLMPDDIHSIAINGPEPFSNLHLYGLALDRLFDRVFWNEESDAWEPSSPVTNIVDRRD